MKVKELKQTPAGTHLVYRGMFWNRKVRLVAYQTRPVGAFWSTTEAIIVYGRDHYRYAPARRLYLTTDNVRSGVLGFLWKMISLQNRKSIQARIRNQKAIAAREAGRQGREGQALRAQIEADRHVREMFKD